MLRRSWLLAIILTVPLGASAFAGEKKAPETKKNPEWLTAWEYPGAKAEWVLAAQQLFNTVMVTTDDVGKVWEYYNSKICVVDKAFKSKDGKARMSILSAAEIELPGGYAVMKVSIDQEGARKLGIKPDFARIFYGARDDSLLPAEKDKKPKERATVVRTLFQDTGEYNIHVVVSRGKDEKHTHVIVTYLRK